MAPDVYSFGDESHGAGESNIDVDGAGFGAFPGSVWIYENSDRTGNADEVDINSWNDLQINVDIPLSLNNTDGTRYLFVQHENLAWSQGLSFTLVAGAIAASASLSFAASGTLSGSGALVADTTLSFAGSGLMVGAGALAGAAQFSFAPAASMGGAGALAAATQLLFSLSGGLGSGGDLSADIDFTFSSAGALTGAVALVGETDFGFDVAVADMDATAVLEASIDFDFVVAGFLGVPPSVKVVIGGDTLNIVVGGFNF